MRIRVPAMLPLKCAGANIAEGVGYPGAGAAPQGVVIEGHGRLLALKELGYHEAEVIRFMRLGRAAGTQGQRRARHRIRRQNRQGAVRQEDWQTCRGLRAGPVQRASQGIDDAGHSEYCRQAG